MTSQAGGPLGNQAPAVVSGGRIVPSAWIPTGLGQGCRTVLPSSARAPSFRLLSAYFAAESLAGGLPGHAQGGGYPVPAPPMRPGQRHALSEQRLISPDA